MAHRGCIETHRKRKPVSAKCETGFLESFGIEGVAGMGDVVLRFSPHGIRRTGEML